MVVIQDIDNDIQRDLNFYRACSEMDRAANLGLYKAYPRVMEDIPECCAYCDIHLDETFYYFNSPTQELILCEDCGSGIDKIIIKKENGNHIHIYHLKR